MRLVAEAVDAEEVAAFARRRSERARAAARVGRGNGLVDGQRRERAAYRRPRVAGARPTRLLSRQEARARSLPSVTTEIAATVEIPPETPSKRGRPGSFAGRRVPLVCRRRWN